MRSKQIVKNKAQQMIIPLANPPQTPKVDRFPLGVGRDGRQYRQMKCLALPEFTFPENVQHKPKS